VLLSCRLSDISIPQGTAIFVLTSFRDYNTRSAENGQEEVFEEITEPGRQSSNLQFGILASSRSSY
jgi:hypothetical protein